jgi:poly(A) polymerase
MQPIGKLPSQDWLTNPETVQVMQAIMVRGKPARFVGGCVRDALLNREISDIDIATSEPPEQVMQHLADADIRSVPIGIDHGSVLAIQHNMTYHITTLRADIETYGRQALVSFIDDWTDDATRRDFTMNALYADLDGTLYDPCNGVEDVKAGRVHFIGNASNRIEEDYLRILRFFRFQAYYSRVPAAQADLEACQLYAPKLKTLSSERVWYELKRLLQADNPGSVLQHMYQYDILSAIFTHQIREQAIVIDVPRLIEIETKYQATHDPIRRLTCILGDSVASAQHIRHDLPLSTAELSQLIHLTKLIHDQPDLSDTFQTYRILHFHGPKMYQDYVYLMTALQKHNDIEGSLALLKAWDSPSMPVRGQDLMDSGLASGPKIGLLIHEITNYWLENACKPNRDQCLQWLRDRNKL